MERNKFSSARIPIERLNYIYPLPWYVNTRTARYCAVKIKYGRESKPRLRFFVWCCTRPAPKRRLSSRFAAFDSFCPRRQTCCGLCTGRSLHGVNGDSRVFTLGLAACGKIKHGNCSESAAKSRKNIFCIRLQLF